MSALIYTSPRSSPSPAGEPLYHPHHQHSTMARHQVAFGQSHHHHQSASAAGSSSVFGNPSGFSSNSQPSSSSAFGVNANAAPAPPGPSGVSSFGFGFASSSGSSSSSNSNTSNNYAATTSTSPFKLPSNAMAHHVQVPTTNTSPNRRRRRRSDSPDDEERGREMEDVVREDADMLSAGKRIRREVRPIKSMSALNATSVNSTQHHASSAQSGGSNSNSNNSRDEFDVGKALASLSKPALLSVLTSLLATQPSLKSTVLSLLPAPSLESFTSTLQSAEKKVLDALPVGRNLRDEYIWSRIRAPLEEYIAEARLALSQFCPSSTSLSSLSSSSEHEASSAQTQQHPATIFSFLFTLTQSVRKLEVILPRAPLPFGTPRTSNNNSSASINNPSSLNQNDPLVCFLPALINQWHVLVTKLSNLVNQNGRVLSAEMVRNWFKQLDALVDVDTSASTTSTTNNTENDSTSVGRKACEAVRERFVKELGWLVGIRTPVYTNTSTTSGTSGAQQQHNQGGIQAVANQFMDSRMMMMDNDESDEEL
ncbi:hypothetical protein P389DRAFT_188866 [Cystobasidium minutum MCA 4210]|uniref:uncharacterized protein n=1 Tax=Cystobasidium minutum MCA 4210 TaxID=1397322 RepID=UPI0034CE1F75|eukprot:jgi/Rhomi1/188866/estExt_fgenesh1_pg.C_3_t10283